MPSLSDFIEKYIKRMLELEGTIELSRQKLAEQFECAPSQINYVLETRFAGQNGYLVESRRGGGGFIRVTRVSFESLGDAVSEVVEAVGEYTTEAMANSIIGRLEEEDLVTPREAAIMRSAVRRETLRLPLPERDQVRAAILQGMLLALLKSGDGRN